MLVLLLVLLLLLLLLEGACVVTPLPTNKVRNGGVGKSETKWGYDVSWSRLGFKAIFVFLSLACRRNLEDS
jgi:hypothetical protein